MVSFMPPLRTLTAFVVVTRGKVGLRWVLHLLTPRCMLRTNDCSHLVEQVHIAPLDLTLPIYSSKQKNVLNPETHAD